VKRRTVSIALLTVVLIMATVLTGAAQSTTKSLSSNFTLVNLGSTAATGTVQYFKPDGSQWKADDTFNLAANGGQAIYRQYTDASLSQGQGSVVVSADQSVGAVVQLLARGQNPTSSGAYSGLSGGDSAFYVPLAAKNRGTASGMANSQIAIQNTGTGDVSVEVELIPTTGSSVTKTGISIKPNASYLYDLALDSAIPDGFIGSAEVRALAGGQVAVVSNFFTGDAMQTFNAFPSTAPAKQWFVPLFTSRLANSLSTPISVQNLSGAPIAAGGIVVTCTDPNNVQVVKSNTDAVPNKGSWAVNPVTDTSIPELYQGSCIVNSTGNVVAIVQMRFINTGEAAAYEAFRGGSTDTKVIVPLVAKRLPNGFATAITIQNMDTTNAATVTLTYTPSPEYVTANPGAQPIVISGQSIPAGGNLIQNHRTEGGVPQLPNGWQGTLVVTGDRPLAGFAQLTFASFINPNLPGGDKFMAHDAFTQP
jgi:hypothetical protein